jgi:hypothetical protein
MSTIKIFVTLFQLHRPNVTAKRLESLFHIQDKRGPETGCHEGYCGFKFLHANAEILP